MILHYFVEEENERKLIETIKNKYLYYGKIKIINTITDFKNDFNNCKNLIKKLEDKEFKIFKLWSRNAVDIYKKYKNNSEVIKKKV